MTAEIGFPAPDVFSAELTRMLDLRLASRVASRDAGVWGEEAAELASTRLGWTDLHTRAAGLIEQIDALRDELATDGVDRIVLAGMGGSSLGAEVIARAYGAELVVIDSTDPVDITALCDGEDLDRSALVVATKSGTTIETVSAASAFAQGLLSRGIDPRSRLIAVTDPDTPMAEQALEEGWRRVFLADPRVGGRFSALAAFGLVPAGLAGADVQQVVDDAAAVASAVRDDDEDNPALRLAAALTAAHARGVRTLALAATDDTLVGLPAWLEQLIAESSGKDGLGILPIACGSIDAHGFHDAHAATAIGFVGPAVGTRQPISGVAVSYEAPLGAQLLVWQTATALLCAGIGVNPFDQPDVEDAKVRARELLAPADDDAAAAEAGAVPDIGSAPEAEDAPAAEAEDTPALVDGPVVVRTTVTEERTSLAEVLTDLLPDPDDEDEYLAVQVFLSADQDADAASLRDLLARKSGGTVAFGWGPRYLHSTGQFHKGGRPTGSFLFVTADTATAPDVAVPEAGFSFAALQSAQAAGDAQVLTDAGRPVVRLTLTDRAEGVAHLLAAVESLPDPEPRVPDEPGETGETTTMTEPAAAPEDPGATEASPAAESSTAAEAQVAAEDSAVSTTSDDSSAVGDGSEVDDDADAAGDSDDTIQR
ncbi:glucose-6-phosphate isomerase [Brevibacterium yomogidense]|uniref:glucose-6-phosphate isomerase n=1 Tax=Brevibacterium yomogidense TaxID=946573 RepID=UPI0018E01AC5|nr:glucose-6-phosphate isomerase [Brevibacterium yomogidense]